MRRGTTPTIDIHINLTGGDMSDIAEWYITISQDDTSITKTNEDIVIEGDLIKIPLSQEETMMFKAGESFIQIRCKTTEDLVVAGKIMPMPEEWERILYNEVI